jgi:hypothetical protein
MHAATASMRLAFEIVARIEIRALGEISQFHEDSDFSCTLHSVMAIAIKHAQLKSTLPSSHHHQSLRASIQEPFICFSGDKAKFNGFDLEVSES